jgi:hypothetical protein
LNASALGRGIAVAVMVGVVALVAQQLFITAWSNHCDPGNAQFKLLQSQAVVGFQPLGELFTWESDRPDNGWTCTNLSLSVGHVGSDFAGMLAATRADMTDSGWTELDLGQPAAISRCLRRLPREACG